VIHYRKNCATCRQILQENKGGYGSKLAKRLYACKIYVKGGEPLLKIAEDYEGKVSYTSMRMHVKKHQNITEEILQNAKIQQLAKEQVDDRVRKIITHGDLRQEILNVAGEMLEKGELKGITAHSALKAAKDTSDIEEKQKDRSVAVMKMITFFASGAHKPELQRGNDATSRRV
jgi:hypothetical protein